MEETINLKELLGILRKHVFMIITITISAVIISGILSFYFITPIYQTSTQILINQKKQEGVFQPGDIQTSLQLTNTYKVIIKSPVILDQVKEKLKLDLSIGMLSKKISVANEKDSQVIAVTVQDKNPQVARNIANTTVEIFKNEVVKIMNIDNVTVLSNAEVTEGQSPIKPNKTFNIGLAGIIGLIISVGISLIIHHMDNTIKKEQDIEKLIGVPVFGVISHMEDDGTKSTANLSKINRVGG